MHTNLNAACSSVNTLCIERSGKPVNNSFMTDALSRVEQKLSDLGWTWADFARALNTTDQRVYNWKKRGIPKSEIDRIADALDCSTDWLLRGVDVVYRDAKTGKQTHLLEIKDSKRGSYEPGASDELEFFGHMDAWDSSTPLDPDEVELPLFREVELAAGGGATQVIENHGAKLRFAKSTLSRAGVPQEAAACAFIKGNSMEPVMPDGTTVGVNTADAEIRDGEIYAIDHDGMLRVKYLHRKPGGGIKIVSQNAVEHPTEEYTAQDVIDNNIRIIGRVFWWSVLR